MKLGTVAYSGELHYHLPYFQNSDLEVIGVVKKEDHLFHLCRGQSPPEKSSVRLKVDESRRTNCTQHHTACHLLNAAIKKQLGLEAVQKSTLVDDDHFRLDIVSKSV